MAMVLIHGAQMAGLEGLPDLRNVAGSLSQRIYGLLRQAILDLTFAPGEVLRKSELADRFAVSRAPVTEAIALLAAEGLVDVAPQATTRVARFSVQELQEEIFLRSAIEGAVVAQVATTRSDHHLTQLDRSLRLQDLLVKDGDKRGYFDADLEFHTLMIRFTGLKQVEEVASKSTLQLHRARQLLLPESSHQARAIAEHRKILEAIHRRDAAAATVAMQGHIGQAISCLEDLEQKFPHYF